MITNLNNKFWDIKKTWRHELSFLKFYKFQPHWGFRIKWRKGGKVIFCLRLDSASTDCHIASKQTSNIKLQANKVTRHESVSAPLCWQIFWPKTAGNWAIDSELYLSGQQKESLLERWYVVACSHIGLGKLVLCYRIHLFSVKKKK